MKILNAEQLRVADKNIMLNQKITSVELMGRAANSCFRWLINHLSEGCRSIYIFCGVGNNGGDGMAIASLLRENGLEIKVFELLFSNQPSADFLFYRDEWTQSGEKVFPIQSEKDFPKIDSSAVVIDAVFGYGLNRPPEKWVQCLFAYLNESNLEIISIDVPSGLYLDKIPATEETVIKARHTLTFEFPKLVFFLPQTSTFTGDWHLMSLQSNPEDLEGIDCQQFLLDEKIMAAMLKPRARFSHKGTFGHALLVGGSYGKIGAMLLSAKACLRSGAGLVSVFVPRCGYLPFQSALPEIMVIDDEADKQLEDIKIPKKFTAVGIGMGMGQHPKTGRALHRFLLKNRSPLLLDADALNILSQKTAWLSLLPPQSVLTPHPKELERLIGTWKDDFEKIEKTQDFARRHQLVVLIKGAHTLIVTQDDIWINSTGNPGMASAGSGDVLSGIITGFLAQGYATNEAAILGVYLHGLAGDLAVADCQSEASLIASDIVENLGNAFRVFGK
ncbi:MAG: bifunctional ADP-dependent NAD(P)H-hydrate dehydratase/NAD(P)H-hydrate epimerase [Flavobacteriales bacterium CG_4_9_14_3_um_filter_40_17]|nr:MAG: bifunctional ADP-dependent NAD(P)H-hydrate dehydratase/NAD(P)H-hydrate epimerase [Flavobacteriales bacterium CG_4_9_14_3_um_filter_40_17]